MKIINTVVLTLGLALSLNAAAFDKKALKDVEIAALTRETQNTSYDGGMHLAWWIPPEYWEVSLLQDPNVNEAARNKVLEILRHYSMIAVVQAEVGAFGNFTFYDHDTVTKGMKLELADGKGWVRIAPFEQAPEDLAPLLKLLTPILAAAMGPMGQNMNFFVLDDHKKGGRVISPYEAGALKITLTSNKGVALEPFMVELPLDSLYVPRRCPNGKPAHISWVVCPWDGSRLPQ